MSTQRSYRFRWSVTASSAGVCQRGGGQRSWLAIPAVREDREECTANAVGRPCRQPHRRRGGVLGGVAGCDVFGHGLCVLADGNGAEPEQQTGPALVCTHPASAHGACLPGHRSNPTATATGRCQRSGRERMSARRVGVQVIAHTVHIRRNPGLTGVCVQGGGWGQAIRRGRSGWRAVDGHPLTTQECAASALVVAKKLDTARRERREHRRAIHARQRLIGADVHTEAASLFLRSDACSVGSAGSGNVVGVGGDCVSHGACSLVRRGCRTPSSPGLRPGEAFDLCRREGQR
jgi:hypothetical protein